MVPGYIGKFDTTVLNVILNSPDVEAVTEDGIGSISGTQYVASHTLCAVNLIVAHRTKAPWGLNRISHRRPPPKGSDPK